MIQAGDMLVLTTGEDCDYKVTMFCRALKDIDQLVVETFRALPKPDIHAWLWSETDAFKTFLIDRGYVEWVLYKEVHLGSYRKLDLQEHVKGSPLDEESEVFPPQVEGPREGFPSLIDQRYLDTLRQGLVGYEINQL